MRRSKSAGKTRQCMHNAPIYGAWKTKKNGRAFALKQGATKWPPVAAHFKIFWAKTCDRWVFTGGKPEHPSGAISISHCKTGAVAAHSPSLTVGVDVEVERSQLTEIAPKFVRADEQCFLEDLGTRKALHSSFGGLKKVCSNSMVRAGLISENTFTSPRSNEIRKIMDG